MIENPENLIYRLASLERTVGTLNNQLNTQTETIQSIQEEAAETILPGHHNMLPNGDFDFTRNKFLYLTDFSDADGATVDADVSEESYNWYTALPDTAVESTGSITSGSPNLTINTPDFIGGDASAQIVVEGAGAAGADLITTISGAPGSTTTATLAVNASTTVTNARVRWRLRALTEDSTDANSDASNATNSTLKTSAHSRYGSTINDPDYNKTDGWARIGSTNWLCAPMPKNHFKPSTTYFATFIYRLRDEVDGESEYPITPFVGLWDNSAGRRQFLEGQEIEITAEVEGTPVSTVSREYFIVFYTNWGEKIGSQVATVANAPADGSFITNQVYVYLAWNQPRGIIRTEIYRKTGSDYQLIGLPYPTSDFKDNNAAGTGKPYSTVAGYPEVDFTRARAITKATASNFAPAKLNIWQFAQFAVSVPNDYNVGGLTDKQWFVLGLQEEVDGLERAIEIDKISIDDKIGAFSRCPIDDTAKRGLSSSPASGSQGNTSSGGVPACPAFDALIEVETIDGQICEVRAIDLVHNEHKYRIVNRYGQFKRFKASVSVQKQVIYELTADSGKSFKASLDHPCFENEADVVGKPLQYLSLGDTILTRNGTVSKVLSNIRRLEKEYTVRISILDGDAEKGFWINGFGGHNAKPIEVFI